MKKVLCLLLSLCFVSGCYNSVAVLGPMSGAANGKLVQSSVNTAINYGIKAKTGKTPLEHVVAYAETKNPEKKQEPCLSFLEKTNSEICAIVQKQLNLTKAKIKTITNSKSIKDLTSSIQPNIYRKSKIKHLD